MIREVVDRRPDHLGHVRDGLVAGAADERDGSLVCVAQPRLEHLLVRVVAGADLTKPRLVPREQRGADPATTELWVDEADLAVDPWPVCLVVPPDAAVRDGRTVDLRDEKVAS